MAAGNMAACVGASEASSAPTAIMAALLTSLLKFMRIFHMDTTTHSPYKAQRLRFTKVPHALLSKLADLLRHPG
jgi:hypothetical protein